jgi:hypothetical protein
MASGSSYEIACSNPVARATRHWTVLSCRASRSRPDAHLFSQELSRLMGLLDAGMRNFKGHSNQANPAGTVRNPLLKGTRAL